MESLDRAESVSDEPTLANVLRSVAYAHLPTRFYQLLQFGIPLGYQAWLWGWPRLAGWMAVLSAFGIWALCEQRLDQERRWESHRPPQAVVPAKRVAGGGGGGGPGAARVGRGVVIEGVGKHNYQVLYRPGVQLMSMVFKCPGCAG
jgi:hypothetical protein